MAFEIACGQCGGHLLVESTGVVVECPLCGAHLAVAEESVGESSSIHPAEDVPSTPDSALGKFPVAPSAIIGRDVPTTASAILLSATANAEQTVEAPESSAQADAVASSEAPWTEPAADISAESDPSTEVSTVESGAVSEVEGISESPVESSPALTTAEPIAETPASMPSSFSQTEPVPQPVAVSADEEVLPQDPIPAVGFAGMGSEPTAMPTEMPSEAAAPIAPSEPVASGPALGAPVASAPAAAPVSAPVAAVPQPSAASGDMVPKQYLILVAGYASAVTIALLYLLLFGRTPQHALESLPDLVPPMKGGVIGMNVVPPGLDVAPGHELHLGESRRFGNVMVTPVKITREPLNFIHAFHRKGSDREPTEPVLKLWLKFENVSKDQEFAPLDSTLCFKRLFDRKKRQTHVMNFVCSEAARKAKVPDLNYVYDFPINSEYLLDGQNLGQPLKPGESQETYVPSEEGVMMAEGPWVWRVQFRKGYNPSSFRGVTTLIDVRFTPEEIEEHSAS